MTDEAIGMTGDKGTIPDKQPQLSPSHVARTKIFLETTGKRYNDLYKPWRRVESGKIEFISLFLMWSHNPAYKTAIPDDFKLTAETRLEELHGAAGAARASGDVSMRSCA